MRQQDEKPTAIVNALIDHSAEERRNNSVKLEPFFSEGLT